jgi:hypothetical protein
VRQKSCGNEVVRHHCTLDIDIKTTQHNPYNVNEPCWQIVAWPHVTILARIEWLLASASLLDSRLQVVFVVCHFGVVVGLDYMLPPLFSEIKRWQWATSGRMPSSSAKTALIDAGT